MKVQYDSSEVGELWQDPGAETHVRIHGWGRDDASLIQVEFDEGEGRIGH